MMDGGMDIAFFGPGPLSVCRNGASAYYRGIICALHERGHSITFYEPGTTAGQGHLARNRIGSRSNGQEWASVLVYPPNEEGARRAIKMAQEADILIKISCGGDRPIGPTDSPHMEGMRAPKRLQPLDRLDTWLEEAVLTARKDGARAVFWDVDAPATLERLRQNGKDPFMRLVPGYDYIFTYGGGTPVIKGYRELGAKSCVPIYNALDPLVHYPAPCDKRFHADMSFLGNRIPSREARMEEFYLRPARMLKHKSFVLGGTGWEGKAKPPNVRYVGDVRPCDQNAFNCSAKTALDVCWGRAALAGCMPSARIFEAAGAGACIITDPLDGIELFFEPGREILTAKDGEEVAEILASLSPDDAREIGQAALSKVLAQHTYAHRAAQFEMVFG